MPLALRLPEPGAIGAGEGLAPIHPAAQRPPGAGG